MLHQPSVLLQTVLQVLTLKPEFEVSNNTTNLVDTQLMPQWYSNGTAGMHNITHTLVHYTSAITEVHVT